MPLIYDILKEVSFRYVITFGPLFKFENNWYGSAIINNSRILSMDSLNRYLIDDKTKRWFDIRINGIENLQIIGNNDLRKIKDYDDIFDSKVEYISNIIPQKAEYYNSIRTVNLLKIGEIDVKDEKFSIYNLHIQVFLNLPSSVEITKFIVTLGNLNSAGLNKT